MMTAATQGQFGVTALIYVAVIALFVWRMMRPMRVTVARIWTRPAILVLFTALAIWGEQQMSPAPVWQVAGMLIAGGIAGIPLGVLRGRHSVVKRTTTPGVYVVQSSPLIVMIWLAAFLARAAIRYMVPGANHGATIWSLALLAFATTAIAASAYMVHAKLSQVKQTAPV